jgi:hypothetical protein
MKKPILYRGMNFTSPLIMRWFMFLKECGFIVLPAFKQANGWLPAFQITNIKISGAKIQSFLVDIKDVSLNGIALQAANLERSDFLNNTFADATDFSTENYVLLLGNDLIESPTESFIGIGLQPCDVGEEFLCALPYSSQNINVKAVWQEVTDYSNAKFNAY